MYANGSVRCVTACAESSLGSAAHSPAVSVGPSFGLQRRFGVRAEVTLALARGAGHKVSCRARENTDASSGRRAAPSQASWWLTSRPVHSPTVGGAGSRVSATLKG